MSRLIDADPLMDVYANRLELLAMRYGLDSTACGVLSGAIKLLETQPTIEPERKTGRWIVHYECPKCGEITKDFTEYCPFCNADMRGEQDDSV